MLEIFGNSNEKSEIPLKDEKCRTPNAEVIYLSFYPVEIFVKNQIFGKNNLEGFEGLFSEDHHSTSE